MDNVEELREDVKVKSEIRTEVEKNKWEFQFVEEWNLWESEPYHQLVQST